MLIRRLCCTPNAHEIDELLHTSPIYTHPQRDRTTPPATTVGTLRSRKRSMNEQARTNNMNNEQLAVTTGEEYTNEADDQILTVQERDINSVQSNTSNNIKSNNLTLLADNFNSSNIVA